ncbi:MAG: hypothetical protein H7A45_21200 [Verrucomicrobiales bacterium]|nr:hypothetical protein [Verrucomicrobiales bacterium]MCP5525694.1 hypothetical protein [Verrucomicrobiales bacterium]
MKSVQSVAEGLLRSMCFPGSLALAGLFGHAGEVTSLVRVGPESRVLRENATPIGPDETVVEVV